MFQTLCQALAAARSELNGAGKMNENRRNNNTDNGSVRSLMRLLTSRYQFQVATPAPTCQRKLSGTRITSNPMLRKKKKKRPSE
jgi:hypothetical protein